MTDRFARLLLLMLCAAAALAQERTSLSTFGRGVAVVFSPDLSVETNCAVYERLGFACYQSPSWETVVEDIRCHNVSSPQNSISVVVLETHGTNGNGLKLQTGSAAEAFRSYASIGALYERLEAAGVRYCILSACNSRRLVRPEIYDTLDPASDRLFLPPTLGIMNARHEPKGNQLRFLSRADSHLESLSMANTNELTKDTIRALGLTAQPPLRFVVSDLLMQLLTNDPALDLRVATPVDSVERSTPEDSVAEALFARFVALLDHIAATGERTATKRFETLLDRR